MGPGIYHKLYVIEVRDQIGKLFSHSLILSCLTREDNCIAIQERITADTRPTLEDWLYLASLERAQS